LNVINGNIKIKESKRNKISPHKDSLRKLQKKTSLQVNQKNFNLKGRKFSTTYSTSLSEPTWKKIILNMMKHAKKLFLVQDIPFENNYRILLRNFQTQMHNIH
jgi:hypothetical protein